MADYYYDENGNLVKNKKKKKNQDNESKTTNKQVAEYSYDNSGNLTKTQSKKESQTTKATQTKKKSVFDTIKDSYNDIVENFESGFAPLKKAANDIGLNRITDVFKTPDYSYDDNGNLVNHKEYTQRKTIGFDTLEADSQSLGTKIDSVYGGWQDADTMKKTKSDVEKMYKRLKTLQNYSKTYGDGSIDVTENLNAYKTILDEWDTLSSQYGNYKNADEYKKALAEAEKYNEKVNRSLTSYDAAIKELDKKIGLVSNAGKQRMNAVSKSTGGIFSTNEMAKKILSNAGVENGYNKMVDVYAKQEKNLLNAMGVENINDLIKERDALKADRTLAERHQELKNFNNINNPVYSGYDPEFEKYAQKGAEIKNPSLDEAQGSLYFFGNRIGAKEVGNIVTYSREHETEILIGQANGSEMVGNPLYAYMTDEEVKVYNYYLAKDNEKGTNKAEKYLDLLNQELQNRSGQDIAERLKGNTFGELLYAIPAGLDSFAQGVRNAFNFSDDYIPTSASQVASSIIREDLADDGFKIGGHSIAQIGYDLTNTTANMAPSVLVGMVNPAAGAVTMGVSAAGNAYQQALASGMEKGSARTYSTLVGVSEAALSRMLSKTFGGKAVSGKVQKAIDGIEKGYLRFAANYGVAFASEGVEEGLQSLLEPLFENIALGYNKNGFEDIKWDEVAYETLLGGMSGGNFEIFGSVVNKNKLNANEQKVFDFEVEKRISALEVDGTKLTSKQKAEIEKAVRNDMEKGQISTDTIEEVLGGDNYKAYKDAETNETALREEFDTLNKMKQGDMTGEQIDRRTELKTQLEELKNDSKKDNLKSKLFTETYNLVKDSRLSESYRERTRRSEAFQADLSQYKGKQRESVERAINSGVLNNTYRSHELVNVLSKIENDKGIIFDYTNNAKLKESGFAIEGKTVNGFEKNGTVTLNIQSAKSWQSVVGHEIAHVLEGTEHYTALQQALYKYAESKGELANRKAALTELYKDMDADIDAELTADLVGDYLFSDSNFIKGLTTNRNLFQKIYDEIKYLCKVATGKELTEIERVKREFDKVWEELGVKESLENEATDKMRFSFSEDNNRVFYTPSGVEVVKNPTDSEYRQMRDEIYNAYPHLRDTGDAVLRRTYDENGNEYWWSAFDAIHTSVEPYINKKYNTRTSQHHKWWEKADKDDYPTRYSVSKDSNGNELSLAVQKRFANSKVVDENGNLKVVYHGTASGEFYTFDKSKGSVEGDFGSGFYFTDNESDVERNYEGGGPDFDNKVWRRAEQIYDEDPEISMDDARKKAKEELYKGGYKHTVYLNIENPAIVGKTYLFDYDSYAENYDRENYDTDEDYEGDVEQLIADDIDQILWDIERNIDVYNFDNNSLGRIAHKDNVAEVLWNAINEGGISIEQLKAKINDLYLEDENGNMVGNEVTRQIIESLGYDGIIDNTVSTKFNMGLSEDTTHYIVFKPNQIKSIDNQNPTDNPDIRYSLSDSPIISKLTDREISERTYATLDKLQKGESVALEDLNSLPEVIEGAEKVEEFREEFLSNHPELKNVPAKDLGTHLINSAEREQLRNKILQDRLNSGSFTHLDKKGNEVYNGSVEKGKRLDIVIGLPAAGKSTSIVLPLSQYYKSVVVDSDIIKQELPEFNEGWGASLVHEESSDINAELFDRFTQTGANIVLPIVGAKTSSVENYINLAKAQGYEVNLHLNELNSSKAMGRMLRRYFSDGRFIPPSVSYKYGDKPTAIYEEFKNRSDLNGYSHWNNDVPKGQRPTLTDCSESNRALAAYSRAWRASREPETQSGIGEGTQGESQTNQIAPIKETSSVDGVFFDGKNLSLSHEGEQPSSTGTPLQDLYLAPTQDVATETPETITPIKEGAVRTVEEDFEDDIAPITDGKKPKSVKIADGTRGDELLNESLDNYPMETVEQRTAEKLRAIEAEIADNKDLRREAETNYNSQIEKLQKEYATKKNKNTKVANSLLQSISRLERLKASTDAEFAKRISDLEARTEKMKDPTYNRAMYKQAKMQEHAEWAENLLGDTSTWEDKKLGLQYATNTERRNLRDIVRDENGNQDIARADKINDELNGRYNREEAALKRELAQVRKKYANLKITKAEDTYIQMLGELRGNPDTELTEKVVNEYYEKHKNKIDKGKVEKVIELARQDYDDLLNRVNEKLREQGMKEIPYRKGYFPHFTEPKQNFIQKLLNWKTQDTEIPTSIAGLTEDFKPVKSWQSFDKTRHSDTTDYSFLKGFDTYSQGALDWIYHLDTLQKRRAVENYIRFTHSDEGIKNRIKEVYAKEDIDATEAQAEIEGILAEAQNPLNNFVQDFMTHTNILTNKKNSYDRATEQAFNRKIYSTMTNVQNRVSANMVLANVRSALTNFIPITQSWAQVSPLRSLQATKDTIANAIKDDGIIEKSTFLTNRLREVDNLYNTNWDKVLDKAGIMFEIVDNFSSQVIWRSKYNQNLANGMTEAQAIKNADQFTENVMAGRSKGNEPTLFNAKNPFVKAFTMFQLEVNNQYGYLLKDVPNDLKAETKHWKFNLAKGFTTAFIGAYVYNSLLEQVAGSGAALDPIGIIEDLLRDLGLLGDDDEEKEADEVVMNLVDNVVEELPFVGGLFGGGRIPISSALPYGGKYGGGLTGFVEDVSEGNWGNIGKEMMNPLLNIGLPVGGGQLKKTYQGLSMFNTDEDHPVAGSYTDSGNLRFPVEDTLGNRIQAGIFGQYANENAREYFDNDYAPLKEKQIQEYVDVDLPIADYWKYREGLSKLEPLEGKTTVSLNQKGDYIGGLDLPVDKKNILINNIADRDTPIDYTGYENYSNFEEFDFATRYPEKYAVLQEQGISVADYKKNYEESAFMYTDDYSWASNNPEKYTVSKAVTNNIMQYKQYTTDLYNIKADKDSNGKSISGSRKEKVIDYVNNLDIDYGAKLVLFKSEYPSDDTYNEDIVNYLNNREDLTYDELVTIYTELGFTVKDGRVYWD